MIAEFSLVNRRTSTSNPNPRFMLHFKPNFGDLSIKKTQSSNILDRKVDLKPDEDSSIEVVERPVAAAVGNGGGYSFPENVAFFSKRVEVPTPESTAGIIARMLSGILVAARTAVLVSGCTVVSFQWDIRVPMDMESGFSSVNGLRLNKIPFLVMNKIGIEHVENRDRSEGSGGWKMQHDACGDRDYPSFNTRWLLPTIQRDLIKLGNQLPFFVLKKLFEMTTSGSEQPLENLFLGFFRSMLPLDESILELEFDPDGIYAHPLALFRSSFVFSMRQKLQQKKLESNAVLEPFTENLKLIYSAQELQEAGVKFIKKENSNLLDIGFDRGVLQIPPLSIDENMTTVLLNFVAYEQCDQARDPIFTNYFLFLDGLINTSKDVEILRKNGIIRYPLGTEKRVVDLFNNFCKEMLYDFDQTYLSVDMNAVNSHCKKYHDSQWRTSLSDLKKERFSSPWTCLSLFAAIVLLILTVVQTFYTVFPYHRPN